jgi:hypothetical protein
MSPVSLYFRDLIWAAVNEDNILSIEKFWMIILRN